jgi:hypothetical protein
MKAVVDHAPALLDEIDARMVALVRELRTLQAQRVQLVMQLTLVSLDAAPDDTP